MDEAEVPLIEVPRLEPIPYEPWEVPEGATTVSLREATRGGATRLATKATLFHDGTSLHVLFSMDDEGAAIGSMLGRDDPIWREDVVEVFLAPHDPTEYFELEVSPIGTLFDARVESPEGHRDTMRADTGWDCDGLIALVRRQRSGTGPWRVDTLVSIPFGGLGTTPRAGDVWHGNLFRIDRSKAGDEYSAWIPTLVTPADFHVPSSFGRFRFA